MNTYLFPTELEAKAFRAMCPDAEVVISGVGMAATAAAIASLNSRAEDVVVLAGIAGAYGESVAVGEVVEVVSEECVELPERFRRAYTQLEPATSLRSVRSNTVHSMQGVSHGADIENMEGAALFAMAEAMGFRAVEVRAISNRVGDSFDKWAVDEAVMALGQELKKFEDEK
jgi:nucleoside phosphorylase